tara:strand:+ start:439 stop:804 length:366 start_codon:yes stop_codon:yes gene_type:complete
MTKHSALTGLKDWIDECLSTDVTPLEIYTTIIETVKSNARYHEICASQSRTLIAMLKNNVENEIDSVSLTDEGWRSIEDPNFLENEKNNEDDPLTYDEMIEKGYEMSGEGIWFKEEKETEE